MPFGNNFDCHNQPNQEQIQTLFKGYLTIFSEHMGEIQGELSIDEAICQELVNRYYEDLSRYNTFSDIKDQDIFKRMGHWAFWVRKLHPLKLVPQKNHTLSESLAPFVNERFSLLIASINCGLDQCVTVKYTNKFIEDFLFHFRYKSVSPHSLSLLFHALYSNKIEHLAMT
jgi:hypothetical protein